MFWIVIGTVTVLGMWSAATATYFAFRDDVLKRLIARQAEMQYAYEDRIAELRTKVDRTTSRQLLDQEQFDQKLEQIMRRQTTLESRATALGAIPDVPVTGSIRPPRAVAGQRTGRYRHAETVADQRYRDLRGAAGPRGPLNRVPRSLPRRSRTNSQGRGVDNVLVRLQSFARTRSRAARSRRSTRSRTAWNRGYAACAGSSPISASTWRNWKPRRRASGMGGPFVPVKLPANAGPFERQLYRINITRAQVERLNRTLALVPYRKPVVGEVEFTSGFGVRSDPFLGRPAMHTGLDFRAATGDPVRATANGKVVSAGWAGGYGRMVEIDHGNGLSTRYGHLSEIGVKVGEPIKIGQVIGEVGSTGRSTGPHLHYETRIDGEAVDPQKFLRAGVRLSAG